jgi:uncharacterized membrane protein YccC
MKKFFSVLYQRVNIKMAVKVALTAVLSFYACTTLDQFFHRPSDLVAGLWCVMAAIVVMQNNIGGTYQAVWNRFLGVLVGSFIGAFCAYMIGTEIEVLGLAIGVTVFLCFLLGIPDSYRIAALSVAIILIPWKLHPTGNPWVYAFFRFFDTCLGFFVAIVVSHVIWPSQAITKMRMNMSEIFHLCRDYFEQVFKVNGTNLKKEHTFQKISNQLDEKLTNSRSILEELKMEMRMQFAPLDLWVNLLNCQEKIWENLRSLEGNFNEKFSEILDEELEKQFKEIVEEIDSALKDLSSLVKGEKSDYDYNSLDVLQVALQEQRIRFRSNHSIKKYQLDTVEGFYVVFYTIKQILITLKQFNDYYHESSKE